MKWFYQVKNYIYENTVYISGVLGALCFILTCHRVFWKKEKSYGFDMDVSRVLETDEILSNNYDFEILSSDDTE